MARSSMAALIARLRGLLAGDTVLTDDELQDMLDEHVLWISAPLYTEDPYTEHRASYTNLEAGARVFVAGLNLLEGTDYVIDAARGIVTTATPDHRRLYIQGRAYDLNAAAADGWERIAARDVGSYDFSSNNLSSNVSQKHRQALAQADTFRAKAWPRVATVERADTPPQPTHDDWSTW